MVKFLGPPPPPPPPVAFFFGPKKRQNITSFRQNNSQRHTRLFIKLKLVSTLVWSFVLEIFFYFH